MTFIVVHDGLPDHPKIEGLSDAAFRCLIECWCWCSRNHTDGAIKPKSWVKRGSNAARAELIAAGLARVTPDGAIAMHDYLEWQRSAAEIDELRAKRIEAGKRGGTAKATRLASATASAKASATAGLWQTDGKDVPDTDTDTEEPNGSSGRRDELWDAVVAECKIDPASVTKSMRGSINGALRQLREVGATEADVRQRCARYRRRWPGVSLTPSALAKNWPMLAADDDPAPVGRDPTAEQRIKQRQRSQLRTAL